VEAKRPPLDDLERGLGVRVHRKDLLELALIHHSEAEPADEGAAAGPRPSNERLEFLGDAVLGAAAASFLYRAYPELDEGALTALRSALVRRSMVARYADDVELGLFVHVGPAEEGPQGRGASSVLSAAFEAVVGAIFLDQGFARTARFLEPFFRRHLPLILSADLHRNAKSELQEYTQGTHRITPTYRLVERHGPPHDSRFVAEVAADGLGSARGEGINRRAAEQAAAHNLLELLRARSSVHLSADE
jgi:ribonuclease-3